MSDPLSHDSIDIAYHSGYGEALADSLAIVISHIRGGRSRVLLDDLKQYESIAKRNCEDSRDCRRSVGRAEGIRRILKESYSRRSAP